MATMATAGPRAIADGADGNVGRLADRAEATTAEPGPARPCCSVPRPGGKGGASVGVDQDPAFLAEQLVDLLVEDGPGGRLGRVVEGLGTGWPGQHGYVRPRAVGQADQVSGAELRLRAAAGPQRGLARLQHGRLARRGGRKRVNCTMVIGSSHHQPARAGRESCPRRRVILAGHRGRCIAEQVVSLTGEIIGRWVRCGPGQWRRRAQPAGRRGGKQHRRYRDRGGSGRDRQVPAAGRGRPFRGRPRHPGGGQGLRRTRRGHPFGAIVSRAVRSSPVLMSEVDLAPLRALTDERLAVIDCIRAALERASRLRRCDYPG